MAVVVLEANAYLLSPHGPTIIYSEFVRFLAHSAVNTANPVCLLVVNSSALTAANGLS